MRRWALNALAQFGRGHHCLEAALSTLRKYGHDPQTAASAIAAIYRLSPNPEAELAKLTSFDQQMVTLAALQHADHGKLDLKHLPINVERAGPDCLKLGLVVVGLDRAPKNMFHPRHNNRQIVKVLGGHHDAIVSQYTVWAITENDKLGLRDLGIALKDIEVQPANVRGWIFQVIGMSPNDAVENRDYMLLGRDDADPIARLGLATGFREIYFDGIDELIFDWLPYEHDPEVRQALLDHIVKNSDRSASYAACATEFFQKEGTAVRLRMLANAVGTKLNIVFRKIMYVGEDLFGGDFVMGDKISIGGNVQQQGGANSLTGEAKNAGAVTNTYSPQEIAAIQSEISGLIAGLNKASISADAKKEALAAGNDAHADTTREKVKKFWEHLRNLNTVSSLTAGAGKLASLAGLLPGTE